jgi:hypothetical protein
MKKLFAIMSLVFLFGLFGLTLGYGLLNNFEFDSLLDGILLPVLTNSLVVATSLVDGILSLSFTPELIIGLGLVVIGLLMGLLTLIVNLKRKNLLIGLLGFLTFLLTFGLVLAAINNVEALGDVSLVTYILSQLDSNLTSGLIISGFYGVTVLLLLSVSFMTLAKPSLKTKKITTKVVKTKSPVNTKDVTSDFQPAVSAAPTTSDQELAELIKLVLVEELQFVKQQSMPSQGIDVSLLRRVVAEEVAKVSLTEEKVRQIVLETVKK